MFFTLLVIAISELAVILISCESKDVFSEDSGIETVEKKNVNIFYLDFLIIYCLITISLTFNMYARLNNMCFKNFLLTRVLNQIIYHK